MGENRIGPPFGPCPRCGGSGADYSDPGSADAVARDLVGNGYPLHYYKGELMCDMCEKELKQDEESLIMAEKHSDEEEFRANAGFEQ